MSITTDLENIKRQVEELAKKIGAPKDFLPLFGTSNYDSRPHIEVNGSFFDYWILERNEVVEHRTAFNLDDLFYWIFQDVTFQMASSYELVHRNPKEDHRRLLFDYQLNLLEKLNPIWKDRQNAEIEIILKQYPYADSE